LPSNNTLRAFTLVQQIVTELKAAESEEARAVAIKKLVLYLMKQNGPLKIIAFNSVGIWRQRYELRKQLEDLLIDVTVFSETPLKPHERYYIALSNRPPPRK
jgi:hypothetical protein